MQVVPQNTVRFDVDSASFKLTLAGFGGHFGLARARTRRTVLAELTAKLDIQNQGQRKLNATMESRMQKNKGIGGCVENSLEDWCQDTSTGRNTVIQTLDPCSSSSAHKRAKQEANLIHRNMEHRPEIIQELAIRKKSSCTISMLQPSIISTQCDKTSTSSAKQVLTRAFSVFKCVCLLI
jgi:hypothetical protein